VFQPSRHSLRVSLQLGWHTAHRFFHGKIKALEDTSEHRPRLAKYTIEPQACAEILGELEKLGITQATVYPDLVSLCENLRAKYIV
jgi:hypothetical protein